MTGTGLDDADRRWACRRDPAVPCAGRRARSGHDEDALRVRAALPGHARPRRRMQPTLGRPAVQSLHHRAARCIGCARQRPVDIRQLIGLASGLRRAAASDDCPSRSRAEVGDGLPVGRRFVGTPTVGVGTSAHGRDYRLVGDRLSGAPPAAGQPAGVLMASPRTVSGRASAERGRGRSQRAYCGGGRLTGCCRDSDRPHAPRPGPPAAAAHHRQSGDPDRSSAAGRAQRPAHGRPLRASDRHHRAPGISRSWPQNGRIPAQ